MTPRPAPIIASAHRRISGPRQGPPRRDELIAWWGEIFEVPCVALDVETREEAEALSWVGADFVGIRLAAGATPAATREFVAGVAAAISVSETAD